jgi:TetR/AcrR family fatty acid metabolism transcriptional regulator
MAKEALQKINGKKRERIFRNAAAEFARHGYHKANINSIAVRAGIGKGSIYLYFTDKRDLYYSTFKEAARIHEKIFDLIEQMDLDPVAKIERIFRESLKTFPQYRNMLKMYFDLSTTGNEGSLADLAQLLERRSAQFFRKVLVDGIKQGKIRRNLPVEYGAYVLDCVYTAFFSGLACSYQGERFRIFTGAGLFQDGDGVETHIHLILNVLVAGMAESGNQKKHEPLRPKR